VHTPIEHGRELLLTGGRIRESTVELVEQLPVGFCELVATFGQVVVETDEVAHQIALCLQIVPERVEHESPHHSSYPGFGAATGFRGVVRKRPVSVRVREAGMVMQPAAFERAL